MTVSIKDRVKQSTTTTGTGTITLSSTPSGYQSFSSVFSNGDTVYYVIENGSMYEIGVGTYSAGTLSRDTVLKSSSGTSLITLSGRSTVFVAVPADKTIYINDTNKASIGLGNLSNVSLTSPASGDIVTYNGSTWSNGNFTEQIQDAVAASFVAGTGIDISYNDGLNTISVSSSGLLQSALNLSDLNSAATARTNLGLGTAALSNSGDFYLSTNPSGYISASSVAAGYQPLDGDLTSLAAATGVNTIYYRSATSTWSPVVIGTGISFSGGTLSNTLDLSSYATSTGVAALYTPLSRTITINGSGQDLTSNRSWTVGDLRSDSSYSDPTWLTSLAWSKISGTPTTISGYGITNAYTKTEVDSLVTGLLDFKGNLDCSANPNYPTGNKGDAYYVSVAGKIGGASGKSVDVGDMIIASADNAGGTEASVGTSWFVLEHNLVGALVASNNLSDLTSASTARGNLGLGSLATITPTGTPDGSKFLRDDYSWQTIDLSPYLTTSSAAATYVPYTGATSTVNLGSQLLTAGTITTSGSFNATVGTITVDTPSLNISQTWNGSGVAFSLLKASITPTLTSANSTWIDFTSTTTWGGNNTPILKYVPYSGSLYTCGIWGEGSLFLGSTSIGHKISTVYGTGLIFYYGSTNAQAVISANGIGVSDAGTTKSLALFTSGSSGSGTFLFQDANNTFAQRNGTTAQAYRLYTTYTSATSGEFLQTRGVAGSNFEFGPSNGSAGGTLRGLTIGGYVNGSSTITPWLTFTNGGVATFNVAATVTASSFTADYGNFTNPSFIIGATSQGFGASGSTLYGRMSSNVVWAATTSSFRVGASQVIGWSSTGDAQASADAGLARNAAGVIEVNNGTAGQYRGLLAGSLTLTQVIATSGSPTFLTATGAAHTTLTASTEATDVNFNLARTVQFAAGALATQRAFLIQAPTYAFASASTITTASTLSISGAPAAGTNATITNAYALHVETGRVRISSGSIFQTNGYATFSDVLSVTPYGENSVVTHGGACFGWTGGSYVSEGQAADTKLFRDGASGVIAQRNGTNAQTFRVYNTYTSGTNYEYGLLSWASNVFRIGTSAGSGGGTMRDTAFGVLDTAGFWKPALTINANSGAPGVTITPYNNNGLTYTSATLSSSYFTASTESTEVNFNLSSTKTWPTGAITTQRAFRIQAPTYAFNGASTITTASTLSISGAPIAGTNATITTAYALNVESGNSNFGGGIRFGTTDGTNAGYLNFVDKCSILASGYNCLAFSFGSMLGWHAVWGSSGLQLNSRTQGFGWGTTYANQVVFDAALYSPAVNVIEQRLGTNAQTFRVYNTYTSSTNAEWYQQSWASNEARLGTAIGSTGGTQRNLILGAWDSAGTFSPKVVIQPTSTGAIYFESATAGTTRGQYAIDLQLYRSASSQIASDYGVTIGTQCTASGGTGSVAIGRNVSVADSIGGAVGIGRSVSVTGYRGVGIGYSTTAGPDALALGTASYAAHLSAICLMGSMSRWNGQIIWEGSAAAEGVFGAAYNLPYIGTHTGGREQATIAVRTTSNTLTTLQSIAVGTGYTTGNRQKHKSVLYHGDFVITAMRSDGACAKFARRVLVKSLADAAGSTYTFSVLQAETIGTDINEISGSAISFATTASTQTVDIQVQGESSYACTGVSATNIITAVGHPYANDDIIVFLTLTGGSSLQANPSGQYYLATYKVINVSGNTFQIATPGSSTTPLALGSDISAGTVSRPIIWTKVSGKFAVVTSGY